MRPDRMILTTDVRMVIENGEIIENYPNDEYLAIISAYLPVPEKWSADFKERIT